jgi:hypothetical protein
LQGTVRAAIVRSFLLQVFCLSSKIVLEQFKQGALCVLYRLHFLLEEARGFPSIEDNSRGTEATIYEGAIGLGDEYRHPGLADGTIAGPDLPQRGLENYFLPRFR